VGDNPYPGMHPHTIVEYLDNGGRLSRPKNAACSQEMWVFRCIPLLFNIHIVASLD